MVREEYYDAELDGFSLEITTNFEDRLDVGFYDSSASRFSFICY